MRQRGFTLIEMLAVVAIIGILAGLFIPQIQLAIEKAKQKGTMKDMNTMATMMLDYIGDKNVLPAQDGPLAGGSAFMTAMSGFYLKVIPLNDQWGSPFYVYCGAAVAGAGISGFTAAGQDDFLIRSYGRDRTATDFSFDPLQPTTAYFTIIIPWGFQPGPGQLGRLVDSCPQYRRARRRDLIPGAILG